MNERKLTTSALTQLARNTGLVGSVREYAPLLDHSENSNALIQFEDQQAQMVAELQKWPSNTDSLAIIRQMSQVTGSYDKVLICDYINEELGRRLRDAGINYLDKAGNAYLKMPSMYVSIQGKQPADTLVRGQASRLFTEPGLKVIFALLTNQDLLNANYRTIADCANVTMGAIGWVLRELKDEGYIVESMRKRGWNDRPRLIAKWVEEYPTLRKKTVIGRFYTQDHNWWKTTELERYDGVLGGETAALSYYGDFDTRAGSIYVGRNKQGKLVRDLQLVKAEDLSPGLKPNIEILRKFWGKTDDGIGHSNVTTPLLTHADLIDTWDSKSREIAEHIANRYLRD